MNINNSNRKNEGLVGLAFKKTMVPSKGQFETAIDFLDSDGRNVDERIKTPTGDLKTQIRNRDYITMDLLVALEMPERIPDVLADIMMNCGYDTNSHEYVGAKVLLENRDAFSEKRFIKQTSSYLDNFHFGQ